MALAERLGAPVYQDTLRQHAVFPNQHVAYGGTLPLDAAALRAVLGGADALLMLGGPFFEEVWYDAVRAVPDGVQIVQLAHAPGVIARNFGVAAGIVCGLKPGIDALARALERAVPADVVAQARLADLAARAEQRREAAAASLAKLR